MHDDQSDLERLRAIVPPAVPTPDRADSGARAALRDAARAERSRRGGRGPRSARGGWRGIAVVIGVTAAAVAGIAATQLDLSSPKASAGTLCAMQVLYPPSNAVHVPASSAPYTAQCRRAWADWRPGDSATPDQFTACRGHDQVIVYHARPDVCSRLGLPTADQAPSAADQKIIGFMNATGRRIAAGGCIPLADARAIVNDELDTASLHGWQTYEGTPRSTDERCATLAFDSDTRTVTLTPMRPQDVAP